MGIRRLVAETRPLHVYIATDDMGDVIAEIGRLPPVKVDRWNYMNYSRSNFEYDVMDVSIESEENPKKHILGETAVGDLWLLSHSDAFVGHLGSRFGKAAWLLAISRRNAFVPFFTVDGHSFCCEIDEQCADMKQYVTSMDNCLTFGHEYTGFEHNSSVYWEVGSIARKIHYLEQQQREEQQSQEEAEMGSQTEEE